MQENIKFGIICAVHKKSLKKILSENTQMDAKLRILMSGIKSLEQQMISLEKNLNFSNNNNKVNINSDFIKVINKCMSYCIY